MLNRFPNVERSDYLLMKKIFLASFMILALGPWFFGDYISGMYGDLMVQVKSGLWMLENKQLLLNDVFSWHEDLNWCPHEIGFYLLSGFTYKIGGAYGCILLSCVSILCLCCLFYRENGKHSLLSLVLSVLLFGVNTGVAVLYNTRPYIISTPLMFGLMISIWNKTEAKKCGVYFCICSLIMAWFHGGMIPLLFVIYAVGVLIDLVYKDFKRVRCLFGFLLVGFLLSLCSPIGVETWTYAATQSQATDVWAYISEWQHGVMNLLSSFIFVASTLLFLLTDGVRRFNRTSILKAAYICMYAILFFKYVRFSSLMALTFLFVMPEVFDIFLVWLYKRFAVVRKVCSIGRLRRFFANYRLRLAKTLLGFSAVFVLASVVLGGVTLSVLPNNSLNDIAEMNGKSYEIISYIKEQGYTRLHNGYNEGTWLLFNDIKVSQDNRCDLYLKEFSGKQYISMSVTFQSLDVWVDEFKPDAVLLTYLTSDDEDSVPDIIRILRDFQKDKYDLVFELETVKTPFLVSEEMKESGDECQKMHWCIFEVIYD